MICSISHIQACSNLGVRSRMQNISYVFAMLGRRWISGLPPAGNVGAHIGSRIQELISKIEGTTLPPIDFSMSSNLELTPSEVPSGQEQPGKTTVSITQFSRDKSVVDWVLKESKGICENCGQPAPFNRFDGAPFLEVHHLRRLADGGSDKVGNAVALCPNCHREFHYGDKKLELLAMIYEKVGRLSAE